MLLMLLFISFSFGFRLHDPYLKGRELWGISIVLDGLLVCLIDRSIDVFGILVFLFLSPSMGNFTKRSFDEIHEWNEKCSPDDLDT